MYGKLIRVFILAVAVAILVTGLATTFWRNDSNIEPPIPQPPRFFPNRDLLEDTVVVTTPAPTPTQPVPQPATPTTSAPIPVAPENAAQGADQIVTLQIGKLAGTLKMSSPTLKDNERIAREHTCNGKNASPALSWSDAPRGTQSFVVLFEKMDAAGSGAVQWSLYNIPASVASVSAGMAVTPALPNGMGQGINDLIGNTGFIGPCIPKGQVPFRLRVFALDTPLNLPAGAKRDDLYRAMNGHIIDMAVMNLIHFYRL